jgi:MinD superfamily P-loop ATPase
MRRKRPYWKSWTPIQKFRSGQNVSGPNISTTFFPVSAAKLAKALQNSDFQQCAFCKTMKFNELQRGQNRMWNEIKENAVAGCHTCRLLYFVKLHAIDQRSSWLPAAGLSQTPVKITLNHGILETGYEGGKRMVWGVALLPGGYIEPTVSG